MRQFFLSLLGSIVGFFIALLLFVFFFVAVISAMTSFADKKSTTDTATILSLDLRYPMTDQGSGENLFGPSRPSLVLIARALNRAKTDDNIKALYIRANSFAMPVQQAEELRLAIKDFQDSGKTVLAYAQGLDGPSPSAYMAISAADEIWMQETTGMGMAGYRAEIEFLGGVFEKFDVEPDLLQFHEYKNAVNSYTKKSLNEPHREAMTAILQTVMDESVANIAADRQLSPATVLDYMQNAPHTAQQAKQAGYITHLGYVESAKDHLKDSIKDKAGVEEVNFQSIQAYGVGDMSGPIIAYIGGEGAVLNGKSADEDNPFSNQTSIGGDTVSKAIIDASKDEKVKAIVFRVSSPGGSPSASDQIWDAVERAKKTGKPVIVSMGAYAASGGYYISTNADKIVAMPSTLTGSIGVFGGKFTIDKTLDKVGYNVDSITVGSDYSAVFSAFEPWNQKNRAAYKGILQGVYDDFTGKVSKGRGLSIENVREIAKGRVWTGKQAKEIGLVDELGGFMKAIEIAKQEAGIDADKTVRLKTFPRALSTGEKIEQLFNVSMQTKNDVDQFMALTQMPEFQTMMKSYLQAKSFQNSHAQSTALLPKIE